jgi:hypothetical protein
MRENWKKTSRMILVWFLSVFLMTGTALSVRAEEAKENESIEELKLRSERNAKKIQQQGIANLSKILDNAFEKYPNETLELLALVSFIDPKHVDDYPIREYLLNLNSMIQDEAVLNFFLSLVQLGQMLGAKA